MEVYLIMFMSWVKAARVVRYKTDPNATICYVRLRENYYIVNPTDILEPGLGNIDISCPNCTLRTLEDAIGTYIP